MDVSDIKMTGEGRIVSPEKEDDEEELFKLCEIEEII